MRAEKLAWRIILELAVASCLIFLASCSSPNPRQSIAPSSTVPQAESTAEDSATTIDPANDFQDASDKPEKYPIMTFEATDGRGNGVNYVDISTYENAPPIDVDRSEDGIYTVFVNGDVLETLSPGAQHALYYAYFSVVKRDLMNPNNAPDVAPFCAVESLREAGYGDETDEIVQELQGKVGYRITSNVFTNDDSCLPFGHEYGIVDIPALKDIDGNPVDFVGVSKEVIEHELSSRFQQQIAALSRDYDVLSDREQYLDQLSTIGSKFGLDVEGVKYEQYDDHVKITHLWLTNGEYVPFSTLQPKMLNDADFQNTITSLERSAQIELSVQELAKLAFSGELIVIWRDPKGASFDNDGKEVFGETPPSYTVFYDEDKLTMTPPSFQVVVFNHASEAIKNGILGGRYEDNPSCDPFAILEQIGASDSEIAVAKEYVGLLVGDPDSLNEECEKNAPPS